MVLRHFRISLCTVAVLFVLGVRYANAYDWLQFGGDPQHSGRNTAETILTPANVGSLAAKYQVALAGSADGAPVFLENVTTPGGVKDLLFVTTRDGFIIALDAQNGAPVWSHPNGPGGCTINNGSTACYTTSSPAIDPNRLYVYSYGLDGKVHKYQVGDGTEVLSGGWPEIATLKGFDEKGSSALSVATAAGVKYLYAVHGGYPGDNGDYQGHVTAINLATGAQRVFNAACSDKALHLDHLSGSETPATCATRQNAIWARPGVFYDGGTNRIFVATGNAFTAGVGRFDGVHNWSESVLALQPDSSGGTGANAGKPLDSYTPANWSSLDDGDTDIGSTGPAILPAPPASNLQHLAVQSGKDGLLRLLDLADLSGTGGPGHVGGSVGAPIALRQGGGVFSQPAVWINPADGSTWLFVVNGNGTSGLRLQVDGSGNPSIVTQWPPVNAPNSVPGGTSPIVANNMLFYISGSNVRVVDPTSGSILRTASGTGGPHWQSLIVAKGVVYATDQANHLTAFAPSSQAAPTTTSLGSGANPANAGGSVGLTATVSGVAPSGSVAFSEAGSALPGCSAVALTGSGSVRSALCNSATLSVGTHALVASYGGDPANTGSSSSPLLQVIDTAAGGVNVAAASAGGLASASSVFSNQFPAAAANDNERKGAAWGNGGGWNDATANAFPDWLQIDFNGNKTLDRVIVYTLQDNYPNPLEPTDSLSFTQYGVTDFTVQGWNGAAWITLGSVSGNTLVKRAVTFPAFTTRRIRINVTNAPVLYSRLVEVEAWGTAAVGPPPAITTLASSLNPSTAGTSLTFTATVTGSNPTGSVAFRDGGNALAGCGAVALAGSGNTRTALCLTTALSPGTHSLVAAYAGDAGNAASSSSPLAQVVSAPGSTNVALASNGGLATASSTYSAAFPIAAVNNNERAGLNWGNGGGWNDATANAFPDWVQIAFSASKTIDRVVVYTLQDDYTHPLEPTDTMTFTLYGITDFTVQARQASKWVTLAT
ncbi:MAG: Ig-like domain repeat protein, partial [Casimicrobiaceae bacterium]